MTTPDSPYSTIDEAIEDIRNGKMVILVDDEDRENEGDLCMAAQFATADAVNFMAMHGRGLICITLTEEQLARVSALVEGYSSYHDYDLPRSWIVRLCLAKGTETLLDELARLVDTRPRKRRVRRRGRFVN